MKTARALVISAVAATLVVSGCSTATEGRAQQDTAATSTAVTCPSGTVLTKIGKCDPATTTTTSPSASPNANPIPTAPDVSACDGDNCSLETSDDEISRLVAESIADVAAMWKIMGVDVSLHLFKGGAADCPTPRRADATAWTCVASHSGGWNPTEMLSRSAKRGATIEDTVRSIIAHEVAHVVLAGGNAASGDLMTDEIRADCLAAGYSNWTMTTDQSSLGQLPLERMKNVLYGSKSAKAMDAGYHGTAKTCGEYTP